MKILKNTLICLLAVAMILATFSACGGKAETAQTTETIVPVADEELDDMSSPGNLFSRGVWSASIDGEIDTYFIFYDDVSGRTERADGTGGVPFTCEQSYLDVVFHFGSPDDVTNAKFSTGDNTGTFDYGDRTVVYTFEYVADGDPDTFVPSVG